MTALITAAALILTATALAKGPKLTVRIAETIVATWTCQDHLAAARTKAASPWKPHSDGYRREALRRWVNRLKACRTELHRHDDTIRRLQRGLQGLPMDGTAGDLERVGRRYGVSPFFIIGVSCKESLCGRIPCRSNPRNIWGLKSCGTGSYVDLNGDGRTESLPYFTTWSQAYAFFARYVLARQPHARTPWDFSGYCECDEHQWAGVVAAAMRRLFGVSPEVRYS